LASDRNRITYPFFPRRREKEEIELYLRSFSLPLSQKLQEKVSSLSGGERQTLALAMHLRSSPSLLLLDEHTSALDPRMGKKVMEITDAAARKQRIPTVVTTHNLDDALNYGNRLIAMNQGKIILDTGKTGKRDLTKDLLLSIYESKAPI
jgi:putative ABC transport system ATP-binding protein